MASSVDMISAGLLCCVKTHHQHCWVISSENRKDHTSI